MAEIMTKEKREKLRVELWHDLQEFEDWYLVQKYMALFASCEAADARIAELKSEKRLIESIANEAEEQIEELKQKILDTMVTPEGGG